VLASRYRKYGGKTLPLCLAPCSICLRRLRAGQIGMAPNVLRLPADYFGETTKRQGSKSKASAIFSMLLNATFQTQRSIAEI
jgi:hypothetical protein